MLSLVSFIFYHCRFSTFEAMNSFKGEIIVKNNFHHFLFNKIEMPAGFKFFVACTSRNGTQWQFTMEKKGSDWEIINAPKVADEILHLQPKLSMIIKRHL
jgi:hypothetical protein